MQYHFRFLVLQGELIQSSMVQPHLVTIVMIDWHEGATVIMISSYFIITSEHDKDV